jgi:hypothetical protein
VLSQHEPEELQMTLQALIPALFCNSLTPET